MKFLPFIFWFLRKKYYICNLNLIENQLLNIELKQHQFFHLKQNHLSALLKTKKNTAMVCHTTGDAKPPESVKASIFPQKAYAI